MEKRKKGIRGSSLKDVLSAYWKGISPTKGLFFSALFLFSTALLVSVFIPIYYRKFFDVLAGGVTASATIVLVNILFSILILHVANWVLWQSGAAVWSTLRAKVTSRLKQNSFDYLIGHSYTFFADNFSGSLVQKIGRFSRSFESLFETLVYNLIPIVITSVGAVWVTWFFAPKLAMVFVAWIILLTIFSFAYSIWKLKYDLDAVEADSATSGYLADCVTNNNAISFFSARAFESSGFRDVSNNQAKKQLVSWRLGDMVDLVQMIFIISVEFLILYYAIQYWSKGLITLGVFVLAQTYITHLANQLWAMTKVIRVTYQGIADAKEMVDILLTPYGIKDAPNAVELKADRGEILFNNVSFNFNESKKVLTGVTTTIKAGEKVAIIGHSGAGKTTFVRLIMRLYEVTKGHISIDGQDISAVTQDSLREKVSFVPQDPILFHRTLMDNIRYGRRDATDEEVKDAARLAHCDEFIESLPLKYETFVGERGIKLSGGERQRIAIARAILKHAPILIFDEATSSLDSYSESLIQDALENLMKDCTTIVIAHRLSTVKKMDRIIAMEDGLIVEEGTHDELANKEGGLYKKLWDLQVGGFL